MAKSKKANPTIKKTSIATGKPNAIAVWCEHHFKKLSLIVLLLGVALRVGLLIELPQMPFNQLHRHGEMDMEFFDQWGDRIADGDLLTDTIWHPYHEWHGVIAQTFGLASVEEGKAKWGEWYGGKQYHQEPLYPLVIGLCKVIAAPGRFLVYLLQMLASLGSIWMIMWLGRHYFSAMAGIAGGLLFTFYGHSLVLDATLLRTSFSTTLALGMIMVAEKLMRGKGKPWLMGLLGGLGYLMWTTIMLLWIPLVVRWLWLRRQDLKASWQVALGFAVILSFLVVRNTMTGSPVLSASSVGPITYILSNFPKYEPQRGFAFFPEAGMILNKAGGHMLPAIRETIDLHPTFWSWVGLQFQKLGLVFHWYEVPNNINTYLAMEISTTLTFAPVTYSWIAALGLVGLVLGLRDKKSWSLLIGLLSQVAVMVIFYVLCRFRVPMVAMLSITAGYAIQRIAGMDHWRKAVIPAAATLAVFLFMIRPKPEIQVLFKKGDVASYFTYYYVTLLENDMKSGNARSAADRLDDLLATLPTEFKKITSNAQLAAWPEKQELADYYGAIYLDQGNLYQEAGDTQKANASLEMSRRLKK